MSSNKIRKHYAEYVTKGGDGPSVFETRASDLGYGFVDKSGRHIAPESLKSDAKLWRASCGSGCPLKLLHDEQLGDSCLVQPNGGEKESTPLTILDIGCGAGHDVFLAAEYAKSHSQRPLTVIGIDFTPEMISAANENLSRHPYLSDCVEFQVQDIEDLSPSFVQKYHKTIDIVLSNGVMNLCRDKAKAFRNVCQLLKPTTGIFVFSDVCKLKDANPDAKLLETTIANDVFSQ